MQWRLHSLGGCGGSAAGVARGRSVPQCAAHDVRHKGCVACAIGHRRRAQPSGRKHNAASVRLLRWKLPLDCARLGRQRSARKSVPAGWKHRARNSCSCEVPCAVLLHTTYRLSTIRHTVLNLRRPCARCVRAQRRDAVWARVGARTPSGECSRAHATHATSTCSAHSYCHTTSSRTSVAHARFGREPARSVARLFASNGAPHPSAAFATSAPGPAHICAGDAERTSAITAQGHR